MHGTCWNCVVSAPHIVYPEALIRYSPSVFPGGLMNRIVSFFLISAFLLTATACGEKKITDPSAIKSKNILSVLKDLSQSYEKKELDAFMSNVADNYPERNGFSGALTGVFANNDAIHFNIQYTRMVILIQDRGQIKATFNWDAEWLAPKGTSQKNGGRATFIFEPTSFKLTAIEGQNPFIPVENKIQQ
jgi:hypothetical protein